MKKLFALTVVFLISLSASIALADRTLQVTPMGAIQGFAPNARQFADGCKGQIISAKIVIDMSKCSAWNLQCVETACSYRILTSSTNSSSFPLYTAPADNAITRTVNTDSPFVMYSTAAGKTAQLQVMRGSKP